MFKNLKIVFVSLVAASFIAVMLPGVASAATPTVPTNLAASPTTNSVVLTWTASSNVPTDYIIEYSTSNFVGGFTRFIDAVGTDVTSTVTGLINDVEYYFRIKGFNGDGTSAATAAISSTPFSNHTPNDLATFDACPATIIGASPFTDTTSADVACVKYYGITQGTTSTTFSPIDFVTRWQMALFLTRMVKPAGATLPSGADQGFSDIAGKSQEIQIAINQIRQLGITIGKTETTFAPDEYVTREEMALFIERLLKAVPAGPGGNEETATYNLTLKEIKSLDTDHNFTDLNNASLMSMHAAIINLWNLGVTEVAAATKYEPSKNISRLNMAQMMANALDHTNARPAGINIQANPYRLSGAGLSQISVTNRNADFTPVANSLVDIMKHQVLTGTQAFGTAGQCANSVASEVSLTRCYIDAAEPKTDSKGNLALFNAVAVSGAIWDIYAWTAAAGSTYDNDIHGTAASKITVYG
jgi:hypothetical protein